LPTSASNHAGLRSFPGSRTPSLRESVRRSFVSGVRHATLTRHTRRHAYYDSRPPPRTEVGRPSRSDTRRDPAVGAEYFTTMSGLKDQPPAGLPKCGALRDCVRGNRIGGLTTSCVPMLSRPANKLGDGHPGHSERTFRHGSGNPGSRAPGNGGRWSAAHPQGMSRAADPVGEAPPRDAAVFVVQRSTLARE